VSGIEPAGVMRDTAGANIYHYGDVLSTKLMDCPPCGYRCSTLGSRRPNEEARTSAAGGTLDRVLRLKETERVVSGLASRLVEAGHEGVPSSGPITPIPTFPHPGGREKMKIPASTFFTNPPSPSFEKGG
jgi:hypothetical protein